MAHGCGKPNRILGHLELGLRVPIWTMPTDKCFVIISASAKKMVTED